jgi:formate-dependent nitrite reductase cytochrome c552 subunit
MLNLGALVVLTIGTSRAASEDTCESCHGDPQLLVKNKKLYDYFQGWRLSVHGESGVGCSDCHGGNPKAKSKKAAHRGRSAKASRASSTINFRNVPATCASCHEDILAQYKKSKHYAKLMAAHPDQRGPNCVTCHGSVNASAINVATVKDVCGQCHGAKNHPEVPDAARDALGRLLTIDRFTRYISLRGEPEATREVLKKAEADRRKLAQTWHTFSLDDIDAKTRALRDYLREERHKVGEQRRHKAASKQKR